MQAVHAVNEPRSRHSCAWCGADTHAGTYLCARCLTTLDVALANIAVYHADLDTIRAKRARYGGAPAKGSVGKTQPLPVDGRFLDPTGDGSRLDQDTRNTVATWTRIVLDEWPPLDGTACDTPCIDVACAEIRRRRHPADTIAACCAYLAGMRTHIAGRPWAGEVIDELLDLEGRLRRMVDRPADLVYRGVCGSVTPAAGGDVTCTRALYADPASPTVRCPDCGTTYDTAERRRLLLVEAEDHEVTARALAWLVATLSGADTSEARIESRIHVWVHRGQLRSHGRRVVAGRPRPVYRVGDVLDLLGDDTRPDKSA